MAFRGGSRHGRGSFSMRIQGSQGLDVEPSFEPSEKYPKVTMPIQEPPTGHENRLVAQFLELRADIRDGPLFTGSNSKKAKVVIDSEQSINDGISRYTDRYKKKRKIGRSIDEHPYVLDMFPAELYPVMGLTSGKSKKLAILKSNTGLAQELALEDDTSISTEPTATTTTTNGERILDKLSGIDEDAIDDNVERDKEEGEEDSGAEEDEDFDEDEDEDDDYNAEKYFDDGDEYGAGDEDDGEAAY